MGGGVRRVKVKG